MENKDWFKKEKNNFFKKEKTNFLKEKKDKEFTPEKALKIAGGMALLGVGVHLAKTLIDSGGGSE